MAARHRRCSTPEKRRYVAKAQAERHMRRMPADRLEVRVYRCRGHWHITSRPAS